MKAEGCVCRMAVANLRSSKARHSGYVLNVDLFEIYFMLVL